VTRLNCGAKRWGLDIRSDVESVTRFSVIESKISLKNERRSRCISALLSGTGKGGREMVGECEGNAVSLAPRACKNRSSYGAAALLEFDIACIRCTPHPVVNVKRIKYFLAAGGPENSNVTTAPRISADFVRKLKLIERLSGRNDCTLACAFTLVTMYARVI